jgi:hydroxymethylpyrimidine pyrophosphatase-like HAD family hydrolase
LPLEAAHKAIDIGRSAGADPLASDDPDGLGVMVFESLRDDNLPLQQYIAWARSRQTNGEPESVRQVKSLTDYLDHPPVHLAFSGGCAEMRELETLLSRELGNSVKMLCTTYPSKNFTLLDIINPKASKGVGVAAAAAELGIAREEIMAMGDNLNDLELLQYAGRGVVMENAEPELHALQGMSTTASNDADGVAIAIEKFIIEVFVETE